MMVALRHLNYFDAFAVVNWLCNIFDDKKIRKAKIQEIKFEF